MQFPDFRLISEMLKIDQKETCIGLELLTFKTILDALFNKSD